MSMSPLKEQIKTCLNDDLRVRQAAADAWKAAVEVQKATADTWKVAVDAHGAQEKVVVDAQKTACDV